MMPNKKSSENSGIGARLPRKEDERHLLGRGRFVSDLELAGTRDVAFVRSPVAHGWILDIQVPDDLRDRVFTFADLKGVTPTRCGSALPGHKVPDFPPMATGKVRYAGEIVAMCLGGTRAEAEDVAQQVFADFDELPAVTDMLQALKPGAPLVHDDWDDNLVVDIDIDKWSDTAAAGADIKLSKEFRLDRQCMVPMEGKGVLAHWDAGAGMLTVHSSTQIPHMIRRGLSECLSMPEEQIRVIAPDVGGGFGYKLVLQPEEICIAWLAMQCDHPVRWIEDRREHLVAGANCREHYYRVTAHADAVGKILGLDVEITVDAGAYSHWPFASCFEAAQASSTFPGPYAIDNYRCKARTVASNKSPMCPYRGVSRTGICFALELMIDAIARAVGREPYEVRLENLVAAQAMPYTSVTGKTFDSGDYPESVRQAVDTIDLTRIRDRQKGDEADGRLIGVGFATYTEQTAHGTSVFAALGIPLVPGPEEACARLTSEGNLEIRVGLQSHGQSLETTLAQVAGTITSIDTENITVIHGDTGRTPNSTGTYASRSMVMAGGAVAEACEELLGSLRKIAGHLLQCEPDALAAEGGEFAGPDGRIGFEEVARACHDQPDDLGVACLEATSQYSPDTDGGVFSYATHAAVVAVDPEIGSVEILDYVVVEDCGTAVNPMVVEGQTYGGTAQGIGTALLEQSPYDEYGQPLASTFADYHLPGACDVPPIRIEHMSHPSPHTKFGIKGVGEGGAVAPPAAIGNAINDALSQYGTEVNHTPMTHERVYASILAGRQNAGAP